MDDWFAKVESKLEIRDLLFILFSTAADTEKDEINFKENKKIQIQIHSINSEFDFCGLPRQYQNNLFLSIFTIREWRRMNRPLPALFQYSYFLIVFFCFSENNTNLFLER